MPSKTKQQTILRRHNAAIKPALILKDIELVVRPDVVSIYLQPSRITGDYATTVISTAFLYTVGWGFVLAIAFAIGISSGMILLLGTLIFAGIHDQLDDDKRKENYKKAAMHFWLSPDKATQLSYSALAASDPHSPHLILNSTDPEALRYPLTDVKLGLLGGKLGFVFYDAERGYLQLTVRGSRQEIDVLYQKLYSHLRELRQK